MGVDSFALYGKVSSLELQLGQIRGELGYTVGEVKAALKALKQDFDGVKGLLEAPREYVNEARNEDFKIKEGFKILKSDVRELRLNLEASLSHALNP